jgi:hypothetical protein
MVDSAWAPGFFVQTPCGPRKSGMPDSVEMPAPVRTVIDAARSHRAAASSRLVGSSGFGCSLTSIPQIPTADQGSGARLPPR